MMLVHELWRDWQPRHRPLWDLLLKWNRAPLFLWHGDLYWFTKLWLMVM